MTILHTRSDPGPALLRVRLSYHQATLAVQGRSELRHHLLRDGDASDILFVSGFRCCRSGLHFWVHHRNVPGRAAALGSTSTRPVLQAPRISKYSQQHITIPALFVVSPSNAAARHSAAFLLTMCSPVLVLNLSQQPSSQFPASFCCGPVVLCGLSRICSPNAAICWLNGFSYVGELSYRHCQHGKQSMSMPHVVLAISRLSCQDQLSHRSVVRCSP